MTGKLFLILGPSGVGKGTIVAHLREKFSDFVFPLSCTTRPQRPTEIDGGAYYFISSEDFATRQKNGEFLENACVHDQAQYGILKAPVEENLKADKNLIREVDVQGLKQIREKLPANNLVTIFLQPPSLDFLRKNILKRGKIDDAELTRRLQSTKSELEEADSCDYIVKVREDDVEGEVEEIKRIIYSELDK